MHSHRRLWAAAMYFFCFVFVTTEVVKIRGFWSSYLADRWQFNRRPAC